MTYSFTSMYAALVLALLLIAPSPAAAQTAEPVMWYQGVLLDRESRPKPDGEYEFGFQLFKSMGGSDNLGPRTDRVLPVVNGTFGVDIPLSTFDDNAPGNYWLQVWVAGEPMSQRVRIGAVPYALRAKYAEGGNVFASSPLTTTDRVEGGVEIQLDMNFLRVAEGLKISKSDDGRTITIGLDSTRLRTLEREAAVEGDVMRYTAGGWAPGPGPSDAPVGTVVAFAGDESAIGDRNRWMVCDGSAQSRAALPELFAVIGTKYSTGETPSGSFVLPDYRGLFLRMVDMTSGRGVKGRDIDGRNRTVGDVQPSATREHPHNYTKPRYLGQLRSDGGTGIEWSVYGEESTSTSEFGESKYETRPVNIGVLYLIKVKP